jgi:hypothetical protein
MKLKTFKDLQPTPYQLMPLCVATKDFDDTKLIPCR